MAKSPVAPPSHREVDPSVDLLMEEYKLLRAEALEKSAKNNQQVSYIQAYGVFLLFIAGAVFKFTEDIDLSSLPSVFRLPLLIMAAALLFYYYSQVYLSSFSFRVLRHRMSELEGEINRRTSDNLLRYESSIAPRYFGQISVDGNHLLPNAWLQFFTFVLFVAAVFLLALTALTLLDGHSVLSTFYVGSLVFFVWRLVWENYSFSRPGSILISGHQDNSVSQWEKARRLSTYVLNYFLVIALTLMTLLGRLSDPTSIYFSGKISALFSSVMALDPQSMAFWIVAYSAICGVVPLPTPSELPLMFIGVAGTARIFIAAALGKAIGSLLLYLGSRLYFRLSRTDTENWRSALETGRTSRLVKVGGLDMIYFLSQATPFAPMRSATIAYAAIHQASLKSLAVVGVGSAVGTVSRMAVLGAVIAAGAWVLPLPSGMP